MKRTGKIARLPHVIRQELNRRLLDNEPDDPLVAWLNAQPQVQTVLSEQFGGNPITKQNLSEWQTGGFAVWELRQEVFGDALGAEEFSDELDAVTNSRLTDSLCTMLAGRFAGLLVRWDGEVTPAFTQKLRALNILCRDLTNLRRIAQDARKARMAMEQEEAESATPGEAGPEAASGVATARRHMDTHTLKKAAKSDLVAPSRTPFRSSPVTSALAGVVTSCRHPERETAKVEGAVKNGEFGKGTAPSESVVPSRTTSRSDLVLSALAEVATSCRHVEPAGKPLPGMPNSLLSKALKAAREQAVAGQPVLTVLPDWDKAVVVAKP
jgi:hypothetical protein